MNKDTYLKTLKKHNIKKHILDAFADVDREKFFDPIFKDKIFTIDTVPIGHGEMSDDPVVLAKMIQTLDPKKDWRLLEIGTGSGYSTSILSRLVTEIVTVEYYEDLALASKSRVINEGCYNAKFFSGDATTLSEHIGDFDGIIIFAACSQRPFSIILLLKNNGSIVFPMGPAHQQQIVHFKKPGHEIYDYSLEYFKFYDMCVFNSIRGRYGWIDQEYLPVPEQNEEEPSTEPEKTEKG